MLAAILKFDIVIHLDVVTIAVILGAQFTTVCIGYAIALWLPINATALVTQIIMIGGLLFSPITFPANRLPEWAVALHQFLPFAPLGELIRETTLRGGTGQHMNILVVCAWSVTTYALATLALKRRN